MHGRHAGLGQVHRTAWISAGDRIRGVAIDLCHLAVANLSCELWLQHCVRTACATAHAVVFELNDFTHERSQHRAGRLVHSLHMT